MKRVLDVGQCSADHAAIVALLRSEFDVEVVRAHGLDDTLGQLSAGQFDLVLINRKLDADHSDGVEILKQIKAIAALAVVPVMLVTNFPEHQQRAVALGAEEGFGKAQLALAATREKLGRFLAENAAGLNRQQTSR